MKLVPCFLLIGVVAGCGYHPVYSGTAPSVRLAVTSAGNRVSEPAAIDAALDGARSVLSAEGALEPGGGYPRLVLEVLRVDEVGRGMFVEDSAARPVNSRGASVAVTVRGYVEDAAGSVPGRDSGDVRRAATYAHREDARFDALTRAQAVRQAAHEAGQALARRILGEAEPAAELL